MSRRNSPQRARSAQRLKSDKEEEIPVSNHVYPQFNYMGPVRDDPNLPVFVFLSAGGHRGNVT